jgi:DNA-binding LacI/PurR family transcriptional regulator
VIGGDYSEQSGVDAIELLLAERSMPTAIFAANDVMAVTALDRLREEELRVPEDVNVVGYDNTSLAALHHISLTTVNQPRVDMGRRAAQRVIERLDDHGGDPLTHVVEPELIVRSTSGPAPAVRLAAATERHERGRHRS